jgi:hypothetical protein
MGIDYYKTMLDLICLATALPIWIFTVHGDSFAYWFVIVTEDLRFRKILRNYKKGCEVLFHNRVKIVEEMGQDGSKRLAERLNEAIPKTIIAIETLLAKDIYISLDTYEEILRTKIFPNLIGIGFSLTISLLVKTERKALITDTFKSDKLISQDEFSKIIETLTIGILQAPQMIWQRNEALDKALLQAARYAFAKKPSDELDDCIDGWVANMYEPQSR